MAASQPETDRIPIGYVRKAHGVRGDVVVRGLVEDVAARLVKGASFMTDGPDPRVLTVASVGEVREEFRVSFHEITDRDDAETLRGSQLTVPMSERRVLSDNEWWPEDLVGCQVESVDGSAVGVVQDLVLGAAQDRMVVVAPDGSVAEVPFVEALVPVVDVPNGRIVVDLPEGLFE